MKEKGAADGNHPPFYECFRGIVEFAISPKGREVETGTTGRESWRREICRRARLSQGGTGGQAERFVELKMLRFVIVARG